MPLNKLENFIKNYEGRILYVNSNDLDATDSVTNQGNSLTKPFKTIQRALIESARFSFLVGNNNDNNARTTILVFPGEHVIDNRPGFGIKKTGTALAEAVSPNGNTSSPASDVFSLNLESNFDLTQEDNILYKFNSVEGGVIIPRGTSIVGLDLRKTRIRPKYVPNPTDDAVPYSAIFRVTGLCYFWQFSFFDADENGLVYTNNQVFSSGSGNLSKPTFSHHKLTCFEYADGVNVPGGYDVTDLDMYYAKLSNAFNEGSGRQIPAAQKFPLAPDAFAKERPEWEIVGAFAADPITISDIQSGDGATPSSTITVTTVEEHELNVGTPIKIRGVNIDDYNISTTVATVTGTNTFTYLLPSVRNDLPADPAGSGTITIETDTVKGASPYIFNCSLRSVWGMNGMLADGRKADGFRSMVVAQFTAVSLQKDDRAFVKYNPITRTYNGISVSKVTGAELSSGSASTNSDTVYHLDQQAVYRNGWLSGHVTIKNDAILQIVSVFAIGFNRHFVAETGADASITNSNSNFGQIALVADGFKKKAFVKDDNGYITSVITPRSIPPTERNIDYISIDAGLTTAVGITSHLYLFGFDSKDNVPPNLISGYRIGARENDKIYLDLPAGASQDIVEADILMTDSDITSTQLSPTGSNSSFKEFNVSVTTQSPSYDTLTLNTNHNFRTGEKVIVISDDADLPEGLNPNRTYYVITTQTATQIQLASSFVNASNGLALKLYGGSNLRILSRVSERDSGETGSPIQFDPNNNNWFLYVNQNNDIYTQINTLGTVGFGEPRTDVTFFKRISDTRSIDEKIYKLRFVIPKEAVGAKDPQEGFIFQESSTTGALTDSELTLTSITNQDSRYKRNNRFISTCTSAAGSVTVITEQPHNLNVGDRVLINNVKSSTNLAGLGITGYNGDFVIESIVDTMTFTYPTEDRDGVTHNVGIFSGPTARDTNLPRFERNDLESNFYIYRKDTIQSYQEGVSDGIFHLYVLNASNAIDEEFTDHEYEQNVVDLYPQLDRDNHEDNPNASKSFAKRFPLGEVETNDLKKSITRETTDLFIKKFGISPEVESTTPSSVGVATITTKLDHGFNSIVGHDTLTAGSGFVDGSYFNVKLYNENTFTTWNGATANIVVSSGAVSSVEIESGGSGYDNGDQLFFEGFGGASITVNTANISSPVNNALQVTGLGTVTDGLYRISSIPSKNEIAIARTTGDPEIFANQVVFNVGPSASVSTRVYDATAGITTITTSTAHGLVAGNRFRVLDNSDNNLGDFIVKDSVGITTFTVLDEVNSSVDRVLKHGFNANNLSSGVDGENLGSRSLTFYDNQSGILINDVTTDSVAGVSTFAISAFSQQGTVGVGTTARFPLGSFIQVNNEIMRVASSTLTGSGTNEISAIRAYLGTQKAVHVQNSLVKKIKPLATELRRPSILRASGHTFEYLGYGPGNYSTALPQVQIRTLTEREDFLAQAQEKSAGQVVYTGMNSDGDFFIGNTKYSASSGKQQTFDIPIPTVTGEDPTRLSVVFDEVIVKERILVEGGVSNQILSQFDGPVTFNENVIINNELKITNNLIVTGIIDSDNDTQSTSCTTGAITTKGGLGVEKNVNICGDLGVGGTARFTGGVQFNSGLFADVREGAFLGKLGHEWSGVWAAGIGIGTEGVAGGTEAADRTIRGVTGDLILGVRNEIDTDSGAVGYGTEVRIEDNLRVNLDTTLDRNLNVIGLTTFKSNTRHEDNVKALFGSTPPAGADGDLEIYHDGSNAFIENETGELYIRNSGSNDDSHIYIQAKDGEEGIVVRDDGPVELYHNGNKKLETSSTGITVTGETTSTVGFVPDVDEGAYLGTASLPFSEAHIGEIRIADTGDNEIDTATGNLIIDSAGGTTTVDDNLIVTGTFNANSTTTFSDLITVNIGIVPDTDEGAYVGTADLPFSEAHFGEIRIAVTNDNTIDTATGNLILDAATGITDIISSVNLGNATTDTITALGRFDSDLIPSTDGARDLGSSSLEWQDLFIDGTAKIDTLTVDENATVAGVLDVNTRADIDNVRIDGNTVTTVSGNLLLDSTGGTVNVQDNLDVDGTLNVDSTSQFDGNVNMSSNLTVAGVLDVNTRADIDNVRIDGNTVSTVSGDLTIDSANVVKFTDTAANTLGNVNTGAAQFDGGVGIAGNLSVGGGFDVDGATTLDAVSISETLTVTGNITANGNIVGDNSTNISGINDISAVDLDLSGTFRFDGSSTFADVIRDEDDMASDDVNALATQQSIKAYVHARTSAANLNIVDVASNSIDINLATESLGFLGTSGEIEASVTGNSVVIGLPNDVTIGGDLTVNNIVSAAAFHLDDNEKFTFGNSNDLEIYHDGNNSLIRDVGTGPLLIRSNEIHITSAATTPKFMIFADSTGGVSLYHNNDNVAKISTLADGAYIHGNLRVKDDIIAFFSSDEKLKDNIIPIDNALSKIMGISGNTFDWNDKSTHEGADTGVIAQEVEALNLPGVVTTRDDGYKAVRYEKLVPLLIEAIKELNAKVEDLENKL